MLSKGLGNWSTSAMPINKAKGIAEAAAKSFTESTFFIYGDSSYIKSKLCEGSLIKHPFKDSCLFVAPVDFKSSEIFQNRLHVLMQKYGKNWMLDHGAHKEHFQWVKASELLTALNKAQDQILSFIDEGRNANYTLNYVTHNVSVNGKDTHARLKLEACFVEFLLTPRCHEVLSQIVVCNQSKQLLRLVVDKNEMINKRLKPKFPHYKTPFHQHKNLYSLTGQPNSRLKVSRI